MRVNFFAFLLSSQFRIKHVPQAIPEQIDAEYSDKDRQPRKNGEPGSAVHITSALVKHRAPGWDASRDAEAEKTQARFGNNDDGHGKRSNQGNASESSGLEVLEVSI